VRLPDHEAPAAEHPPDRGDRGHVLVAQPQLVGDRLGARVDAELGQLLAQGDDLVIERFGRAARDRLGRPGACAIAS
jgi:hypothetical protein